MKEDKFKSIVKKLKHYMKMKNITEIGLFHKLDKNNDGFISNIDFNATIDSILQLAPAVKDQFFNFLDFYHNGLVRLSPRTATSNNIQGLMSGLHHLTLLSSRAFLKTLMFPGLSALDIIICRSSRRAYQ